MKSKCCNKPLRLSRENPQRGETVYYICEGCNQPADPKDDYVDKNYPDEREVSKLKEASMQSKPQLSAEMEKRFDEEFPNEESGYLNKQGEYVHLFNPSVDSREIKTFLATELERQREEYVEAVKNRKATIKWLWGKQKTDDECFLMVMEQVQRIAEFAKLNQLKGE